MPRLLPLEVRRHYTSKPTKVGDGWVLKCDMCGETFNLLKPPPGLPVEAFGLRMLETHTRSHHNSRYYRVTKEGKVTTVESISPHEMMKGVLQVGDAHITTVLAVSAKHGKVIAEGLISKYIREQSHGRKINP